MKLFVLMGVCHEEDVRKDVVSGFQASQSISSGVQERLLDKMFHVSSLLGCINR